MERNREARRGNTPAMNGNGGVSRRKQRSNVLRDYPEDGVMDMHDTSRLRDRGGKKDRERDRDRFSRSKRRRMFHGDDAEESSEESVDDEVDDDEAAVRHPLVNHAAPAATQSHQQHSDRKGLVSRMPPWDEINLLVPRKARSKGATVKRIHEPWISAGGYSGGGGGGEQNQRQFSTSPSRLSPSASQISSNSNKMKSLGGTKKRQQQASSTAEELEVAELLTVLRTKEECSIRIDKIDDNGMNNDAKSSIRSPSSISQPVQLPPEIPGSNPPLTAVAPKRKRPRQISTVLGQPSTLASSSDKLVEDQPAQHEACLPKLEMLAPSPAIENGGMSHGFSSLQPTPTPTPMVKQEHENPAREKLKEEVSLPEKEISPTNVDKAMTEKISPVAKNLRKEKFTIDLMAPPEKSSPERDGLCDFGSEDMPVVQEFKPVSAIIDESNGVTRKFVNQNGAESLLKGGKAEKSVNEEFESKKQFKGKAVDLPIDLENADNMDISKHEIPKQQSTSSRVDTQSDKTVPTSLSMPTTMAGWPGSFPQFGYMAQVPSLPAIIPSMDAATGSSSICQPPNMPSPPVMQNRCSKHLYIAQSIQYNQKIIQMNPFWHASAGAAQLFVPKPPANLNVMPPLDPILGNPLQGGVPGRSLGSLQDTKVAPYFAAFTGQPSNASIAEAAHRTQLGLPQMPPQHPGLHNNMIPSPALFYPINQHQAMAAAAAAAVRSGAAKSSTGVGSVAPSSGVSNSAVASSGGGGAAVAMNLGYSTEQYLAILQNSGYPIPLPAHLGGPPAYRGGTNPSPAMPPFSGPFYQSQMLHSQLQPTSESAPQKPPHTQPGHPNTSTSTGSSSSQKQQQQLQRVAGGGSNDAGTSSHGFPSQKQHHSRPIENEAGGEDGPSSADSRVLQAQKSLYAHNMAMSIQSQNAAMLSTAAAASVLKHTQQQQQHAMKGDLTPSQAFAMSYPSNNGGASLSGMNYSSMAQGHTLFQSLPDITRQGYQMNMAAAAAAAEAPTSAQQKKAHSQAIENGKSAEPVLKSSGIGGSQHFSSFAKPDNERQISTSHGNGIVESSSGAANSSVRTSNRSTNAAIGPTNTASLTTPTFQQFQFHRAQELQMQRLASAARAKSTSSNNAGVYSSATTAKFPQTVSGFSHGLTQSGSPTQPQWKNSGRASTPTPTATADQLTSRNQQQLRSGLTSSHQANISFGANSMKSSLAGGHAGSGTASVYASSTAGAPAAPSHGSPSNSFSKSNGGSPRASASENQTTPANAAAALPPQSYTKSSTSSSNRKSSSTENVPTNPSHTQQKQLQQMQQQYRMQSQQPIQKQTQFFFNGTGAYMQAQAPQSSAPAASIFYRQQLEQQQSSHQQQHQKQSVNPVSAGLTLAGSSGASDPSKASGAPTSNSMKGMPPPGLLHAANMAAAASGTAHPLMSPMFPFISMPSAKPGDQKPATGNDNLNASWQPEKRS